MTPAVTMPVCSGELDLDVSEAERGNGWAVGISVTVEVNFDLNDAAELLGDPCDDVAEGLIFVVVPLTTNTPLLFSQQRSAGVPTPQQ